MKTKRKYFYLDDFEHRLLVGCDCPERVYSRGQTDRGRQRSILKIIDAPSKKLRVIAKEEA